MTNTCTKFEFNPSTSWGSYARHRHHLLHGARSTTDVKPWHKHTTGELKIRIEKSLRIHFKLDKLQRHTCDSCLVCDAWWFIRAFNSIIQLHVTLTFDFESKVTLIMWVCISKSTPYDQWFMRFHDLSAFAMRP